MIDTPTRRIVLGAGVFAAGSLLMIDGSLAQAPLAATPACHDGDDTTVSQTEGPYFKPSSPERTELFEEGMAGQPIELVGFVLSRDCKPVARALLLRDALRTNAHGGLEFGPEARPILKGEKTLSLVLPPKRERRRRGKAGGEPNPIGDPLFEALRAKRRELAQEAQVPPYVIFHDSVLRDMASARPRSIGELGRISGVGARKLEAYGSAFLDVIREAA